MTSKTKTDQETHESNPAMNLALFGAAGSLGQQVMIACEGEGIAIETLTAVGSSQSVADHVAYQGKSWKVLTPGNVEHSTLDAAIIATPEDSASGIIESLHSRGVFTIDASGAGHQLYPLKWPLSKFSEDIDDAGGVSIPGPIASTVTPVLTKLSATSNIASVHIVVLLTASSQGRNGPSTLSSQTLDLLNFRIPQAADLGGLLAFNILPGAHSGTEAIKERARREVSALVPSLASEQIYVQCVRVPVFSGIACTLHVEFEDQIPEKNLADSSSGSSEVVFGGPLSGLRDTLDNDSVLVAGLERVDNKSIRCICFSDPTQRTANTVSRILQLFALESL